MLTLDHTPRLYNGCGRSPPAYYVVHSLSHHVYSLSSSAYIFHTAEKQLSNDWKFLVWLWSSIHLWSVGPGGLYPEWHVWQVITWMITHNILFNRTKCMFSRFLQAVYFILTLILVQNIKLKINISIHSLLMHVERCLWKKLSLKTHVWTILAMLEA